MSQVDQVSPVNPAAPAVIPPAAPARQPIQMGRAGVQLASLEDAFRFSKAVAVSGFAPKGMEREESVLVAIQLGLEIGLTPMAALQNIAVINGRPGVYGDAALALVRASGLCAHFSETETNAETDVIFRELQFAVVERDLEQVKVLSKRLAIAQSKHTPTAEDFGVSGATLRAGGVLEFGRFTVADAKRAGLWGKSGPWSQYPARMLKFRQRSFLLRDNYGDVLKGLRSTEELADLPAGDAIDVTARPLFTKAAPAPALESPSALATATTVAASDATAPAPASTTATPSRVTHAHLVELIVAAGLTQDEVTVWARREKHLNDVEELGDLPSGKRRTIVENWSTVSAAIIAARATA